MVLAHHGNTTQDGVDLDLESARSVRVSSGPEISIATFLERDRIWRRYAVIFLALYLMWALDIVIETNREAIKVWIQNSFNWTWQDGI